MKSARLFDVSGAVVLVTGAASGLGLAMAEVMAENGARVTMADIDAAALHRETGRLASAGHAVTAAVLDVTDADRLHAVIDGTAAGQGRIDVVFANAGISAGLGFVEPSGEIANVSLERWDKVLRINLTSVFVTLQAAIPHMKRQKSGRIIVTSSIAGTRAEPLVGYAYVATKAAVSNLVRQAALELAPHNVLINAIAPGPFRTNIGGGRLGDPRQVERFAGMAPLGRIAETAEIKGLALLLASPASSYMTGAVIPIDGGACAL